MNISADNILYRKSFEPVYKIWLIRGYKYFTIPGTVINTIVIENIDLLNPW